MEFLTEKLVDFGDLTAGKENIEKNFINWTSGDETIDSFIQKKQLQYNGNDAVFEWIPYNELINIKEIENDWLTTATWKKGPLFYDKDEKGWIRKSCEKVILRFLYNSQDITDEFTNKVESYLLIFSYGKYGISQNPDTKIYILVFDNCYFRSYCKKCGDKYGNDYSWLFEWIPYNELIYIKEAGESVFAAAVWTEGPLSYSSDERRYIRKSREKVYLKQLHNSQKITEGFLNEVESLTYGCYGISQNPDTKIYFLILSNTYFRKYCEKCGNKYNNFEDEYREWCKQCQINNFKNNFTKWTSGNEKIDEIIQKRQLKIDRYNDIIVEWIPYNELIGIKEIGNDVLPTATWTEGPLRYNRKYVRKSCETVFLKHLYNLQDITEEFLNEVESYLTNDCHGISQNPDTKVYILILEDNYFEKYCEKCENIEGGSAIAMWKNGPLIYKEGEGMINESHKKVGLRYLHNLQDITNEFLDEVESFLTKKQVFGISQNPDTKVYILKMIINSIKEGYGISQYSNTKDFILVLQLKYYCENCGKKYRNKFEIDNKSCTLCQINHKNKKISDLIYEMEINIDYNYGSNMKFEWIPYDQFNNIEEIGKGGFSTVYSAIWKDGLLEYDSSQGWNRKSNTKVALKCIHNSQNHLDKFINEVKVYPKQKIKNILKIYGISQNPITKDYIMVLEYAVGGSFNSYLEKNCENLNWASRITILRNIIQGLDRIHQKHMVHRDFHVGNILITKAYAAGRQPFADCAHDEILTLKICNGIRPEINDQIAPKCYIDLMEKCWDPNPDNRPNSIEVKESIELLYFSLNYYYDIEEKQYKIKEQFENLQFRKANQLTNHVQAIYTSRLLNPFTKNLSKYNFNNNTIEVTDFTKLNNQEESTD
ncbi:kinase-like domain-containing protein [Rhizophagus clarus]|uniref:Kinase-like domain-containing protein n=1 Tax=Rhizophagus clarus TaxID=94130 RepID=A0A8H3QX23_9GLOM|nr:kinase-like domain-containing protein [Rhizophagus clarus]